MERMERKFFKVVLAFAEEYGDPESGWYICNPYLEERNIIIDIQKACGYNRLSQAKKEAALLGELKRQGLTIEDWQRLERLASRQWNRMDDLDETSEIIITPHQSYGALRRCCEESPSAQRPCDPQNLRHLLFVSVFRTGKFTADGVWVRGVLRKSGMGMKLSSQRQAQRNEYIKNFTATGVVGYTPGTINKADQLPSFLERCGQHNGFGASRIMGKGRFHLVSYEPLSQEDAKSLLGR